MIIKYYLEKFIGYTNLFTKYNSLFVVLINMWFPKFSATIYVKYEYLFPLLLSFNAEEYALFAIPNIHEVRQNDVSGSWRSKR